MLSNGYLFSAMKSFRCTPIFPMSVETSPNDPCPFYRILQPFYIIQKAIGNCCIRKAMVGNILELEQRPTCVAVIAIVARMAVIVYCTLNFIFAKLDVEGCTAIFSAATSTIICLCTEKRTINIILKLESTGSGGSTRSFLSLVIGIMCFILVTQVYSYVLEGPPYAEVSKFVRFLCLMYHRLSCVVIIIEFKIFVWEVRNQFMVLNESIKQIRLFSESQVEACRVRYEHLVSVADDISSTIGIRLFVPATFMPMMLLIRFYNLLLATESRMSFLYVSILVMYFIAVHSTASLSSEVKKESYECMQNLEMFAMSGSTTRMQLLIKLFQEQICARPVEITTAGFFPIDKRLIPSILLTVTTYSMVILQIQKE